MYSKIFTALVISILSLIAFGQNIFERPLTGMYINKATGKWAYRGPDYEYVGGWKDSVMTGRGTLTYDSGNKYVGEFKDSKFNGQGTFTFANGDSYVGEFKDDEFSGIGTLMLANGELYVGQFANDTLNGRGAHYGANGAIIKSGLFKNNQIVISDPEDFSVPAISNKYVKKAEEEVLANIAKASNEEERKKYAGAALNQGKTGPVGFGAIKLGMHILDIYALPKSEAIRIPENGWKTTAIPHNNAHCLNKSALDQLTCGGPLPTEISFSDWKSRPEKFPERIDFEVNISNPFVERELRGFLGAKNGILTTIRLDLSSFSSYEQEIIMLRDNVLKLLNEKFGYTKPVVEKREVICGQTRFAQITTSHDWKDNNKLLGTVISNLKTEEVINCYNWMQPYREVKVVLTIVLPSKNAAPSIKNVF